MDDCSLNKLDAPHITTDWLANIFQNYKPADVFNLNALSSALTVLKAEDIMKMVAICKFADVQDFPKATLSLQKAFKMLTLLAGILSKNPVIIFTISSLMVITVMSEI